MRDSCILAIVILLVAVTTAVALETRVYQMREDFSSEPLSDAALQYYYYIPCATYSWYFGWTGWEQGDIIGQVFQIGDVSTGAYEQTDPVNCQRVTQLRVLDLIGYGGLYPARFGVKFDIYCADEYGCPVGPSLWRSETVGMWFGWNYIGVNIPLDLCDCAGGPGSGPRVLATATHTGSDGLYPAWGTDNVSTPVNRGCPMHDYRCLPALYPRPYSSHYSTVHSGFYGQDFQYCPPQWFKDLGDSTQDGTQYGFVELCWRLYINCEGPSANQPTTWGSIKSMYR